MSKVKITIVCVTLIAVLVAWMPQDPRLERLVKKSVLPDADLLVLLHGYGSNEEDLFGLSEHLPGNMHIVSLRAPIPMSAGSYAWYRLDLSKGAPQYSHGEAERARVRLVKEIEALREEFHARHVYLLGFSQGAIMSFSIALTNPESISGIVALSGRIPEFVKDRTVSPSRLKQMEVFIGHGSKDDVLPLYNGTSANLQCTKLGMRVEYHQYDAPHTITEQELSDLNAWLKKRLK